MDSDVSFCQHQITWECLGTWYLLPFLDLLTQDKGARLGRMAAGEANLEDLSTHRITVSQHHPKSHPRQELDARKRD